MSVGTEELLPDGAKSSSVRGAGALYSALCLGLMVSLPRGKPPNAFRGAKRRIISDRSALTNRTEIVDLRVRGQTLSAKGCAAEKLWLHSLTGEVRAGRLILGSETL